MKKHVFVITSESKNLKVLRGKLKRFFRKSSFSKKAQNNFLLAVSEACANSIKHSYEGKSGRSIRVSVKDLKNKVEFRIRDYGKKINLAKVKQPLLPPRKPNGLGIYLLKNLMDEVRYITRHSKGTELVLIKKKGSL